MPLMGLDATQLKFKQDIKTILEDAYKMQFQGKGEVADNMVQKAINKTANDFATEASEGAIKAILNFLKEIKIDVTLMPTIIAPPVPPVFPGGPATGNILFSNIKVS